MGQITDPAFMGWAMGLFVLVAGGVVRWLVQRFARQFEALEQAVKQIDRQQMDLTNRVSRLADDVANDKAGRRAFADAVARLEALTATVGHVTTLIDSMRADQRQGMAEMRQEVRDVWSRVNRLAERHDAA